MVLTFLTHGQIMITNNCSSHCNKIHILIKSHTSLHNVFEYRPWEYSKCILDMKYLYNKSFKFVSFNKMARVPQIPSRKVKSQKHSVRIQKPKRKSREQEYYIDESRPATSRTGISTARSNASKRTNVQEYQLTGG